MRKEHSYARKTTKLKYSVILIGRQTQKRVTVYTTGCCRFGRNWGTEVS